ncbi:hypothetical protein [Eubacterium barkeri]|uniref:hypothetical protein n=1 Tax=Eubacterium barkeri TaxID=1528 RepID=UPI0015A4712F|nr:hypothetical protein [Eubacterium barkeri]
MNYLLYDLPDQALAPAFEALAGPDFMPLDAAWPWTPWPCGVAAPICSGAAAWVSAAVS